MKDEMDGLNNLRTSRLAQELPVRDPLGATSDIHDDSGKPFLAALESVKAAFERYFPSGSTNRFRWFQARVQISSGSVWADITPQVFSSMVEDSEVELRLCEEADDKLDVCILPIGHNLSAAESQNYYDIKVITVGSMSVGKSMMHQYFTKKEEQRRDMLPPTLNVVPDITNRLMTAQGELVKATLWDTAGQERFRAMTQSFVNSKYNVDLSLIPRFISQPLPSGARGPPSIQHYRLQVF
ncbi:Ras- protein Rab-14 [Ceratobasidium sp. 395]|nr:Ras- protein Rab-14 [Ceratobasidium sp. 395]